MVKRIKNTPFWNVLRRGCAATLALIVVAMSCFVPISAADEPTEPTEPVYSEGLAYSFSGTEATVTGPGTWTGTDLVIPSSVTVDGVSYVVTTIGDSAFQGNDSIVTLSLPATCDRVEAEAFRECVNLTTVNGGSAITTGNYAFAYNPLLTSVDFSCWYSVQRYCFNNSGLVNVVLPSTVYSFDPNCLGQNLKTLFYSYPTIVADDPYASYEFPVGFESLHYGGTLRQYCDSVIVGSKGYYGAFRDNAKIYISGELVEGALYLPDGAPINFAFSGYKFIDTLYIPSSAISKSNYRGVFAYCTNLKTVYVNKNPGGNSNSGFNAFYNCTGLEYVYWGDATYSLNKNYYFQSTNNTFTLCLSGTSDQYTLTNFTNPVVYDSVFVAPDFTGLYSDSLLAVQKGNPLSLTLKPLHGYKLPSSVQFNNAAGESLGWTPGVEYTYDSTTGQISIVSLNQNVYLNAVGVSAVPNYRFFNSTLNLSNLGNVDFQFTANDFNGQTISGAFSRLNQDSLAYELYYVYDDSDQLVYNGSWLNPCYRYLDFGSNEIPAGFEAFLSVFASVPPIGSMLSQIYNASGGGSSGGSYDAGYSDGYALGYSEGYNVGYSAGYAEGSAGNGSGGALGIVDSVLALATYRLDFVRGGQVVHSMNVNPQYNLGSVYFGTLDIVNAIADYEVNNGDIDGVNVVCTWADSDAFDFGQFPLYVTGTSLVESGTLLTSVDVSLSLQALWVDGSSTQDLRRFEITSAEIPAVVLVKSVSISVGRPQDLLKEFTLCSSTYFFNQGYSQGYTVGYSVGSSESRTESYNTGYHNGFIEGKSEGITIAEKGNFYNLFFSVSDAVYSNFLNLLNFEVLGVNMKVVFGSFLTVCLVLIVIFKFTGKN